MRRTEVGKEAEARQEIAGVQVGEDILPFAQPHAEGPFAEAAILRPSEVWRVRENGVCYVAWRGAWEQRSAVGCLSDFLKLAEAHRTDSHVEQFVEQWGPLWIFPYQRSSADEELRAQLRGKPAAAGLMETTHIYFRLARKLQALLNIAVALKTGKPTQAEDWHCAVQEEKAFPDWHQPHKNLVPVVGQQKAVFAHLVSGTLLAAGYAPALCWTDGNTPSLTIEGKQFRLWDTWRDKLLHNVEAFTFHARTGDPAMTEEKAEASFYSSNAYSAFINENPCPSRLFNLLRLQTLAAITAPDIKSNTCAGCGDTYEGKRGSNYRCKSCRYKRRLAKYNEAYQNKQAAGSRQPAS